MIVGYVYQGISDLTDWSWGSYSASMSISLFLIPLIGGFYCLFFSFKVLFSSFPFFPPFPPHFVLSMLLSGETVSNRKGTELTPLFSLPFWNLYLCHISNRSLLSYFGVFISWLPPEKKGEVMYHFFAELVKSLLQILKYHYYSRFYPFIFSGFFDLSYSGASLFAFICLWLESIRCRIWFCNFTYHHLIYSRQDLYW